MSDPGHVAAMIFRKAAGRRRVVVGIAGPPGAGKSAFAETLLPLLPEGSAAIVQMDAFHLDNTMLERRGLLARKGAPETFDFAGFRHALARLREADDEVVLPAFDRRSDIARAGAVAIPADTRFLIVEGNYLLLDESPWYGIGPSFDLTVFIDAPKAELARRLVQRWVEHGLAPEAARERAFGNDMANVERVLAARRDADITIGHG